MPKSKRNKLVELSKTKKHGMEGKEKLQREIQSCIETYANLFIFSVNDMRNAKIKSVREKWRHSRFFIGKNKVMARALGSTPETEFRKNIHKIASRLRGERGLLFSNQPVEDVLKWFNSYSETDYARSGNRATETVVLNEGPLSQFPHNLEPYLRQLGLPTTLKKGVIHIINDYTVCKEGDILTPDTAKIVKLLGYEMSEFFIKIECVWSQDGSFLNFMSDNKTSDAEGIATVSEDEEMEIAEPEVLQNGKSRNSAQENSDVDDESEEIPQLVDLDSKDVNVNSLDFDLKQNSSLSKHKLNSSKRKNNKTSLQNEEEMEIMKEASFDEEDEERSPQKELNDTLNGSKRKSCKKSLQIEEVKIMKEASFDEEDQEHLPQKELTEETEAIDVASDDEVDEHMLQNESIKEKKICNESLDRKNSRDLPLELAEESEIINEETDAKDIEKVQQNKLAKEDIVNEVSIEKDSDDLPDNELIDESEIMKEPMIEEEEEKAESPIVRKLRNRSIKVPKNK